MKKILMTCLLVGSFCVFQLGGTELQRRQAHYQSINKIQAEIISIYETEQTLSVDQTARIAPLKKSMTELRKEPPFFPVIFSLWMVGLISAGGLVVYILCLLLLINSRRKQEQCS